MIFCLLAVVIGVILTVVYTLGWWEGRTFELRLHNGELATIRDKLSSLLVKTKVER